MIETRVDSALSFRAKEKTLFLRLHESPARATLDAFASLLGGMSADSRLFLDLRELDSVSGRDVTAIRSVLAAGPIPAGSVYFKGTLGFSVAVDGNKVLIDRGKGAIPPEAAERFRKREVGCGGHGHGHHCHCGGDGHCRGDGSCGRCHHDHEHQHFHEHHDVPSERRIDVAV